MKLLLDQNLSCKLVSALSAIFPESRHVKDFNLTKEQDEFIWSFAAKNGFTIVSKDSDFVHLCLLRGHPPKVVHVRLGNSPTKHILEKIIDKELAIKDFISGQMESFLVIE